jgi:hypothetical protein
VYVFLALEQPEAVHEEGFFETGGEGKMSAFLKAGVIMVAQRPV